MLKHNKSVIDTLRQLKSAEVDIIDLGMCLMKSANGHMYIFDQFAIATLNRAVAISSAFNKLINEFNMIAAGALLRIHLDTALRYFASHLVDDCNEFADSVVRGEPINKMCDSKGKKLTDFYLSNEFEKKIPGTRKIYKAACDYVHFSHLHTTSILDGVIDPEKHIVSIKIGSIDRKLSDRHYIDACKTFTAITRIIIELVQSWIDYKTEESSIIGHNNSLK